MTLGQLVERSLHFSRGARAELEAYAAVRERRLKSRPDPLDASRTRAMTPAAPTTTGVIGYWFRARWGCSQRRE
ncbi:hypothetical protein CH272_21415 [Rhodococcus sp. 05-340-1]|nr:hypothetical protein CH271_10535 [Rhodococcus sp. 05-340-2]OZD74201.1 hypothetical protein CH272_21415 [Rhodococcus sp. 05-340-1]OZF37189.1 hypothetical protein CH295_05740 [Rhodococcus sp. 14-2483-1-2]